MQETIKIHEQVTGSKPLEWYTGRSSPNTRQLVIENGGFRYDSDSYDTLYAGATVLLNTGRQIIYRNLETKRTGPPSMLRYVVMSWRESSMTVFK